MLIQEKQLYIDAVSGSLNTKIDSVSGVLNTKLISVSGTLKSYTDSMASYLESILASQGMLNQEVSDINGSILAENNLMVAASGALNTKITQVQTNLYTASGLFSKIDGSINYTAAVGGSTPITDNHLTTKDYVDAGILNASGALNNKLNADYIKSNGTVQLSGHWDAGSTYAIKAEKLQASTYENGMVIGGTAIAASGGIIRLSPTNINMLSGTAAGINTVFFNVGGASYFNEDVYIKPTSKLIWGIPTSGNLRIYISGGANAIVQTSSDGVNWATKDTWYL